ncbi:hypothetical protein Leryth_015015 [Lithospermum erythrorhizon]|nr:hypothetical protein Leryth_015015 [Lithospermum erythrorhizon]
MENNSGDKITPLLDYENATTGLNDNTTSTNLFISSLKRVVFLITGLLVVALVVVAYVCSSANGKVDPPNDVPLCASNEALKAAKVVAGGDLLYRRRVPRGVLEGFSPKSNDPLKEDVQASCVWTRDMLKLAKVRFTFQPKKNWMNDPCGPLYYKGNYHIFYQYNPGQAVWGNITWGHAISKDLIHWDELPLAFEPSEWYDVGGVFTGSATVLPDGRVIMLFTGADKYGEQLQNLAYPADPSDPLLTTWTKYPGNPILTRPPGIGPTDFRDPSTAWLTGEGKWRITIGSKYNRTGISLVYDTTDFINYELRETLLHSVEGTGEWECVDFFPVSTINDDGLDVSYNGPNIKHVVKASMDDDRYDTYAIGTYNDAPGTWVPDDPTIDVGLGLRYDYGTFYASKSFYDGEKKRRVLWGYVHEADYEVIDVLRGWASIYNVPRTIVLDRQTGTNLLLWPVEEVEQLRSKRKAFNNVKVSPGSVIPLDVGSASQLDIEAEFEIDAKTLEGIKMNEELYTCNSSQGAAQRGGLGPFGLLVLSSKSLSEFTAVYFYIIKSSDGSLTTHFCSDQSRSSLAYDVIKKHLLEVRLFLFNNATDASIKASIQVWQMGSAQLR